VVKGYTVGVKLLEIFLAFALIKLFIKEIKAEDFIPYKIVLEAPAIGLFKAEGEIVAVTAKRNELVSIDFAKNVYGVVIDPETFEVND